MYTCEYFKLQELVPKHVYEEKGKKAWWFLDDRALITLDTLREELDVPLTVNNWVWGGDRQWSGLRTSQSPYGSEFSQHRYGRAFDVISSQKTADELREHIFENEEKYPHIRGVELGVSWLHFDVGNRPGEGIYKFNP